MAESKTRVTDILTPSNFRIAMESLVGRTIYTFHGDSAQEYVVSGVTQRPLRCQNVYREAMTTYFKRKHGIRLQLLDYPCFETVGTHVIPVELAYFEN
jgi:hypothetical protein